ncbi:hypothetical protein V6U71_01615 [Sphingopyxis sp. J-6]|uniref:5-methylcytosine restriction system specificity protein McrC n=1 Tax=Sphingopyxis sp. J-6 TaxID=3122054 RepID=UPI0039844220
MKITLRERSSIEIGEDVYRALENSSDFWKLVDEGIFVLLRSKGKSFGLRANAYVGQFSAGDDLHVHVIEKVQGSVAGLLRLSAPDDLRSILSESLHGQDELLLPEYAKHLTRAVGRYISHGRVKAYVSETKQHSRPVGRIDLRASLTLSARGSKGKLVCTQQVLSADLPSNQIIGLSLAFAEALLSADPKYLELLGLCRSYARLFEDVDWRGVNRKNATSRDRLFAAAFSEVRKGTDLYVALGYARALILHLGSWAADDASIRTPHSYFLNLESLFENAVRAEMEETHGKRRVKKGSELNTPLLSKIPNRYIVDPDVVIIGEEITVIDCKYKDISDYPSHSDLYQLEAHAQALEARMAILVYPGDVPRNRSLGTTRSGVNIQVAQVRPQRISTDLEALFPLLSPTDGGSLGLTPVARVL